MSQVAGRLMYERVAAPLRRAAPRRVGGLLSTVEGAGTRSTPI